MFCNQCGAKIADGSLFCSNCGAKIKDFETVSKKRLANNKLTKSAKVLIVIFLFLIIGIGVFLTVHFLGNKKDEENKNSENNLYVLIDGAKYEISYNDGINDLDKIENGIVLDYGHAAPLDVSDYEYYRDGKLIENINIDEFKVCISKFDWFGDDDNGTINIYILNNMDFEISDGTGSESELRDLRKAGYVDTGLSYDKLFNSQGEISIDTINSDYEKLIENGYKDFDYDLPGDIKKINFSDDKEKNRETLIETFSEFQPNLTDCEAWIKYLLLRQKERINTFENKNDFLIEISYIYYDDNYKYTEICIYASKDKLNQYMSQWGLPDSVLFSK
ncbi:MAG: zinc-ribbon domain-containing protein [Lachnospiraceae bacterium]|nr:zinc-ribbon domain-containing protein [Lachnospiraceae bacterium]